MPLRLLAALLLAAALPLPGAAGEPDAQPDASLPAVSRPWSGADYQQALAVFQANKVPLPHLATPEGAALLDRLTSLENLALARNRDLALPARLGEYGQLSTAAGKIFLLYVNRASRANPPHGEVARWMAFILEVSGVGGELMEELPPLEAGDPQAAARQEGLRKVRQGMAQVFQGAALSLTEHEFRFTPADHLLILRAMDGALPRVRLLLASDVKAELRRTLKADQQRFTGEHQALLAHMVDELAPAPTPEADAAPPAAR